MLSVCTTGPDADVGLISHHMVRLATRVGHELATEERVPVQARVTAADGGSPV